MKSILDESGLEMEFLPPSPDMARYISVFNISTWKKKGLPLPAKAGPKIALCVSNVEKFLSIQNNTRQTVPRAAIVGPVTVPYHVSSDMENLEVIFCEFTETGFYRLFCLDASFLENSHASLFDILDGYPLPYREKAGKLPDDLAKTNDSRVKINIIEDFLRSIRDLAPAGKSAGNNIEIIEKAILMIKESWSQIKILEICQKLAVRERTLERWFLKVTGITVKQFINISRFTMLFNSFMQKEGEDLLQDVYRLGYSDQAHAIREFKKYSGFSPGKIVMDKFEFANKLSDPFCKTIPADAG